MKGNNGKAARRKKIQRAVLAGVLFVISLLMASWTGFISFSSLSNNENEDASGSRILRNIRDRKKSFRHKTQTGADHDIDEALVMKEVLAANYQLVDLTVRESELMRASKDSYAGVYGKFCKLDWSRRKKDPSAVPMFRHLVEVSSDCEVKHTLDLKKVADLARHLDDVNGASWLSSSTPKVLNFTMGTFHESRCGSTLVANAVAAMDSEKHRSYSEAGPPAFAMNSICGHGSSRCTIDQAAKVLQDTIYLMSRSNDPLEERVFFKFQSATTKNVEIFKKAFPDTPWLFVYRDPVQVVMSHIKDDPKLTGRAICMRSRVNPPFEIRRTAKSHGVDDIHDLSMEEYCALHLATITESAVASLNDVSIPVDYETLPHSLHETILPRILGRSLTPLEVKNIEAISQNYSKGAGSKHKEFQSDSEAKEKMASPSVKAAAVKFLQSSFEELAQHQPQILQVH